MLRVPTFLYFCLSLFKDNCFWDPFYYVLLDIYIEAMGMPNESYTNKRKELANLNIIWSDDVDEIVNNLLKIFANKF